MCVKTNAKESRISNLCPPNIRIFVHSVGSVPNIQTAAAGNGAATRSPVCLQSLPPDIQRFTNMMAGLDWERRRAFRMIMFYKMHNGLVAIHPTLYLTPRQYHTSHKSLHPPLKD